MENTIFHCLVGEGKWRRQKTREKFFSLGPTFLILPNREEKLERKVLSHHFYTNTLFLSPLKARNTIIFLSNISKLKHNQIIRIQTQKHKFKINQIITIKAKKEKEKEKKDKRQKTEAIWPIQIALGMKMIASSRLGQLLWDEDDPSGLR